MTTLAGQVGLAPKAGSRAFRTGPWSGRGLAAIVATDALAIILAMVGWWNASGESRAGDQIGWLNVSLAGVVITIGANGLFLARGRQTIRLATTVVLTDPPRAGAGTWPIVSANGHTAAQSFVVASPGSPDSDLRQGRLVSVAGTRRYHRPGCALVAAKAVEQNTSEAFSRTGRHPCEVCEP
jgi:hypothetical protein